MKQFWRYIDPKELFRFKERYMPCYIMERSTGKVISIGSHNKYIWQNRKNAKLGILDKLDNIYGMKAKKEHFEEFKKNFVLVGLIYDMELDWE